MAVELILQTCVAGLVGTSAMSAVMGAIHATGLANADMIRALGSLVTRSLEGALGPGLVLHALGGLLFAVPYAAVLGALSSGGLLVTLGMGALLGLVHGLVMSIVLLAVVSEKHPVPQFRGAGFEVGVAHILGHVAYGLGVALMVAVMHIDWGLRF